MQMPPILGVSKVERVLRESQATAAADHGDETTGFQIIYIYIYTCCILQQLSSPMNDL